MRISKLLSAGCALALLTGFFSVRADDTPAQAAARAAFLGKISELDAKQSQSSNTVTAPPPATAPMTTAAQLAAPVTAVPETKTPPPVIVVTPSGTVPATAEPPAHPTPVTASGDSDFFTPVPPPSNPNIQAIAPGASSGAVPLTNQWQSNQQSSAPPPVVIYPPPAKPAMPATVPPKKSKVASAKPAVPTAVRPKKSKVAPAKPAAPVVAPVVKPPPQADLNYAGKSLGFKPVEAPPPPVSAQKVAELQTLLAKYMANQISPDEYQKVRAAILAEP
jgi:hypothetical protein